MSYVETFSEVRSLLGEETQGKDYVLYYDWYTMKKIWLIEILVVVLILAAALNYFRSTPIETYTFKVICPETSVPKRLSWIKGERISDVEAIEQQEKSKYSGFVGEEQARNCEPRDHTAELYLF